MCVHMNMRGLARVSKPRSVLVVVPEVLTTLELCVCLAGWLVWTIYSVLPLRQGLYLA